MDEWSPPSCPKTVTVRRNPPRKARPTPSTLQPTKLSNSKTLEIPSFPLQDILSINIDAAPSQPRVSENLRVYLRIRPLLPPKPSPKRVGGSKNVWPKSTAAKSNSGREKKPKKKSNEVCISVNDSHSVTLSPPSALQDFKRIKSEVFQGFSYVFPDSSSQNHVYEEMMKPLVDDFLKGKNGMIAALGPSGSGKTHTVFGTPRDPGMVLLALKDIFKQSQHGDSNLSRSFYISVFEISSERGKTERFSDLSPDGDLWMQQSTVKGLKEVAVSDAAHAESLISHAMLKRATAMTNSNSQSSRSQCIINIHYHASKFDEEVDTQPIDSVLTIVDLAGAEREKRTGNQGSRLLESNFINNTSMVFGQCLRSLLEHQKNPKRPLQKHFQNSLLTRYLRDYLEGKKRMNLILTAKPGEEDYLDTTYLLRQASPYMKIKFKNAEEPPNSACNKRHNQTLSRAELPKRVKHNDHDADAIEEEKVIEDGQSTLEENPTKDSARRGDNQAVKSDCVNSGRERSHLITQNFAKALWNVLKQYKHKLMVAETEIQSLTGDLRVEKTKYVELEKELEELKSCCRCSKENPESGKLIDANVKPECLAELDGGESCIVDEVPNCKETERGNAIKSCSLRSWIDEAVFSEIHSEEHIHSTNPDLFDCSNAPECESTPVKNEDVHHQNYEDSYSTNSEALKCSVTAVDGKEDFSQEKFEVETLIDPETKFEGLANLDSDESCTVYEIPITKDSECSSTPKSCNVEDRGERIHSPKLKPSECSITAKCKSASGRGEDVCHQKDMDSCSLNSEPFDGRESPIEDNDICTQQQRAAATSQEEAVEDVVSEFHNIDVPKRTDIDKVLKGEKPFGNNIDVSKRTDTNQVLKEEKPKRRLLPASSVLLRDVSALGIGDETETPKGNRRGKNLPNDESNRTQGSLSLLRLLQRNFRL